MKYKVISLWQPWASLVVQGYKLIETRPWNTHYRGLMLIHATISKAYKDIPADDPLYNHYHPLFAHGHIEPMDKLPFGAIIGAVNLIQTIPSENSYGAESISYGGHRWHFSDREKAFGNYQAGRHLWLMSDAVMFDEPIPAKGLQGFWNWEGHLPKEPNPYTAPKTELFQ